jgi:hypothetical protein
MLVSDIPVLKSVSEIPEILSASHNTIHQSSIITENHLQMSTPSEPLGKKTEVMTIFEVSVIITWLKNR